MTRILPRAIGELIAEPKSWAVPVGMLAAFVGGVLIASFTNSDLVAIRSTLLLGAVLWAPFLGRARPAQSPRSPSRLLAAGCAIAAVVHVVWFARRALAPDLSISDIAATTVAAFDAVLGGLNPYHAPVDLMAGQALGFVGYKYLPVTLAAYAPALYLFGGRGILVTNLIADFAVAWLIFRLGRQIGGRNAGLASAFLYLALPLLMRQNYSKATNDLVALAPTLLALFLQARRPGLSGFWLGLSMAAKPLPALAFLPCCLPDQPRPRLRFAAGLALGLLPALLAFVWSPTDFFDNIVRFNLLRSNNTSWLFFAPAIIRQLVLLALALAFVALAAKFWRLPAQLPMRAAYGLLLTGLFILAGPVNHQNYLIWWMPVLCLLVGTQLVALWPARITAISIAPRPLGQREGEALIIGAAGDGK